MRDYLLSPEIYIIASALSAGALLFLVLRGLIPRILSRFGDRYAIDSHLTTSLGRHVRTLLAAAYLVFALDLLLTLPLVKTYAGPVLAYPLLDVETLALSIASLAKGFLAFYILLVITKIARTLIQIVLFRRSEGKDVVSSVDILVYNTALVIISLTSLSIMGISWKLLLPVAGALGIGIGFGVRDIANNFVSGFVVLTSKTVKRGDWITLGDYFGKIIDIGIRTSTLRTLDNIDIIIPNSHLISNELINWSYTDNIVRTHIPVGVSYSSDVNLVRETLIETAKKSGLILDQPQPEARFLQFGESSLDFELLVWVDLRRIKIPLVKSMLNYAIWDSFAEKGIQVPFPQRDVWFKNELKIEGK
jgi:small-conductance mechanosensitive channel